MDNLVREPKALSPGEKMAIQIHRGEQPQVFDHPKIRQHVMVQSYQREAPQLATRYWTGLLPVQQDPIDP